MKMIKNDVVDGATAYSNAKIENCQCDVVSDALKSDKELSDLRKHMQPAARQAAQQQKM